jgi:hypothetical protein
VLKLERDVSIFNKLQLLSYFVDVKDFSHSFSTPVGSVEFHSFVHCFAICYSPMQDCVALISYSHFGH